MNHVLLFSSLDINVNKVVVLHVTSSLEKWDGIFKLIAKVLKTIKDMYYLFFNSDRGKGRMPVKNLAA